MTQQWGNVRTWSTSTDTLGIVASLQQTVNTTNGELETSLGRTRLGLGLTATSLARGGFATG